jgi:hypothetical protein
MTTIRVPHFPTDMVEAVQYYTDLDMHLFPVKLTTRVKDGATKLDKSPLAIWISRTPSGGHHIWFKGHGRNSASSEHLGPGLDTRADGARPGSIPCPSSQYCRSEGPSIFGLKLPNSERR